MDGRNGARLESPSGCAAPVIKTYHLSENVSVMSARKRGASVNASDTPKDCAVAESLELVGNPSVPTVVVVTKRGSTSQRTNKDGVTELTPTMPTCANVLSDTMAENVHVVVNPGCRSSPLTMLRMMGKRTARRLTPAVGFAASFAMGFRIIFKSFVGTAISPSIITVAAYVLTSCLTLG